MIVILKKLMRMDFGYIFISLKAIKYVEKTILGEDGIPEQFYKTKKIIKI